MSDTLEVYIVFSRIVEGVLHRSSFLSELGSHIETTRIPPTHYISHSMKHWFERASAALICIALFGAGRAEAGVDSTEVSTGINTTRMVIVGGGLAATIVGLHIYQANAWWKDDRGPFHFQEDINYYRGIDKFGHCFGTFMSSYVFDNALHWAGMEQRASALSGAALGLLWETYIEVEDGYATQWGFSPSDFYADAAGASLYAAHAFFPALKNYTLKWSYYPSPVVLGKQEGVIPGQKKIIVDDYEGQAYWIVANLKGVLGEDLGRNVPDWLGLAIGYGARNLNEKDSLGNFDTSPQKSEFYIALDYDLGKLIGKTDIPFVDFLINTSNYIHWPQPALRVYPEVKFYLLYPVRF